MRFRQFMKTSSEFSSQKGSLYKLNGYSIAVWGGTNNTSYDDTWWGDYQNLNSTYDYAIGLGSNKLDILRNEIGGNPVILKAMFRWFLTQDESSSNPIYFCLARLINVPDWGDASSRYRDVSASETWAYDGYAPWPGVDVSGSSTGNPYDPYAEYTSDGTYSSSSPTVHFDITDELARALRRNERLYYVLYVSTQHRVQYIGVKWDNVSMHPYMDIWYMNEIEFFEAANDGEIDFTSIVDPTQGDAYYLGAVGVNETGAPHAGFILNLGDSTKPIVEIYDDHPEWTDPTPDSTNSGSGELRYVTLANSAISQKYTVKALSSTTFEVVAEAYRDQPTGLHTSFDGDTDWQGSTSSDFTAPSGGLTIPSKAWLDGMATDDLFVFYVRGNTSDQSWPADSAQQVYIARDNGSDSPDTTTWRRSDGRHDTITDSVTIDATTKKIPIRAHSSSLWVVDSPAFIADDTNINEGTVKSAGEAAASTPSFTGTGTDDLSIIDKYYGNWWDTIRVEIDATGTPDTFKWSKDGGSTWEATGQNLVSGSSNAVHLVDGVYVYWTSDTGHTVGDYWDIDVNPFYVELENLTANSNTYAKYSRIGTTLPLTDVSSAVWGQATSSFGSSSANADQIPMSNPSSIGFSNGDTIYVEDIEDSEKNELATVQSVESNYLDLTNDLTYDYGEKAFVIKRGSGEAKFWMQARALGTADEGVRTIRLNART